MHSDESLAGLDPIEERLLVWERENTGRVCEDDAVVIFERVGRHFLRHILIVANVVDGKIPAFLAEFGEYFFSRGNRAVAETFCNGDDQKLFGGGFRRGRKFKQEKTQRQCQKQWPSGSDIHCFHMI